MLLLELGDMGIAEDGDAVRLQPENEIQRLRPAFQRLLGQPVDHVDIDAGDAFRAQQRDGVKGLVIALQAVNGLLHGGIAILDPKAGAIDARARQRRRHRRGEAPRIDLDRELRLGRNIEAAAQRVIEAPDIIGAEDGG